MTFTSAGGGTVVTLPGDAFGVLLPRIDHAENVLIAGDGTTYSYNHGVNEWYYEIQMNVSESQRSAVRSFIITTLQFAASSFKVTPDATVDLGKGAGVQLADVRYRGGSYAERIAGPGRFDLSFVLSTVSIGTSAPA